MAYIIAAVGVLPLYKYTTSDCLLQSSVLRSGLTLLLLLLRHGGSSCLEITSVLLAWWSSLRYLEPYIIHTLLCTYIQQCE